MQPPIATGSILQNRYRVLSILGQGGFGRTYLAEDQGRFNERCALKEFIPPMGSNYALTKARELFQREATILYQISHPQIPQFRATFEENQRLFLVQDYVEGKTYRLLLNERKARGTSFSDAEALQLIYQILPVLAHIHSKGIIHRDIAPDNIILRQQDNLPVLIDFGVVKELATRFQSQESDVPTTVGKLGYAPSEQMQTGRAYPNSDLYSLAVTAVVLMTGREPQELYDDRNLTWNWLPWVPNIHPGFAEVLNRMLSYRPGDRYQSVSEVAQALQAMVTNSMPTYPSTPPAYPTPPTPAPPPAQPLPPDLSQMKTMAVGRRAEPTSTYNPSSHSPARPSSQYSSHSSHSSQYTKPVRQQNQPPMIPTGDEPSIWENPWAVLAIGTGLATVTGIAAWAIVSALLNTTQPTPIATPSPTPVDTATPTPAPSPQPSETLKPDNNQPVEYSQRLNLPDNGELTSVEGSLQANEAVVYIVPATQGQVLTATLEGEGVLLSVLTPDRQPANDQADRVLSWKGSLDATGDYAIRLSPVKGVSSSNYKLKASLEAAVQSPSPEPNPSPSPSPSATPEFDVRLLPDNNSQISSQTGGDRIKRYLVNAQPGQVLKAEILQGAVTLNIHYPDGRPVENASGIVTWNARIFEGGEYQIDVVAQQPTDFALNVQVQDPASPPENPLPPN